MGAQEVQRETDRAHHHRAAHVLGKVDITLVLLENPLQTRETEHFGKLEEAQRLRYPRHRPAALGVTADFARRCGCQAFRGRVQPDWVLALACVFRQHQHHVLDREAGNQVDEEPVLHCGRAGNRRFWRLSTSRAHFKPPYKTDLLWKTLWMRKRPGRARTVVPRDHPRIRNSEASGVHVGGAEVQRDVLGQGGHDDKNFNTFDSTVGCSMFPTNSGICRHN